MIYKLLILLTLPNTIVFALGVSGFIICCPCICILYRGYQEELRKENEARGNLIESIFSMKYDKEDFKQSKECSICLLSFEDNE